MNAPDDPFLGAVIANPADRTARRVYADWLDERDDPRGELVRACEGMRDEPVWSDRYWQLKLRRNELRTRVPLAWLEATGYDGSYYDPVFRSGVSDGVRERWRLIREFTERWHGVEVPDAGGWQAEVRETECSLGTTLPESAREFVAFAHDVGEPDTPNFRPGTLSPLFRWAARYRPAHVPDYEAVGLIEHAYPAGAMAVACADLGRPDPPAYHFFPPSDSAAPVFRGPTLSQAVFSAMLWGLPAAGYMSAAWPDPDELLARLAADFPVRARFGDADVFEGDEVLVFVNGPRFWDRGPPTRSVTALVRRPVPPAAVPDYLIGTGDRAGSMWGLLEPEAFGRYAAGWRSGTAPPAGGWVSAPRRGATPSTA